MTAENRAAGPPPSADVVVPDGVAVDAALARTTDLGVGAHPDDLELLMVVPIAACRAASERWFTGVTCTDGAGSARAGRFAALGDAEMVAVRRAEQRAAAELGRYGAMVQLGHASAAVRTAPGRTVLVDQLEALLRATRPTDVYTHNLADKHTTHVVVAAALIAAIRRLPVDARPARLLGVEGWRDLDWLDDDEKVTLDASGAGDLAARLAGCFISQIEGGKRYDLATEGRRRANATFGDPHAVDDVEQATVALDLTPLIRDDTADPAAFVTAAIDRFRATAEASVRSAFGGH